MTVSKKNYIFVFLLLLAGIFVLFAAPVLADYTPIVQCGGADGDPCTICDIPVTISRLINYVVYVIATPLAIFMVIVGGFMMLTAGPSPQRYETGKKALLNTLIGIAFIYFSWMIVNTILLIMVGGFSGGGTAGFKGIGIDKFINWNSLPGVGENCPLGGGISSSSLSPGGGGGGSGGGGGGGGGSGGGGGGGGGGQEQKLGAQQARAVLSQNGIPVNKGECPAGTRYQDVVGYCTSLNGVLGSTINGVIDFKKECKCSVMVTGGTELGHTDGLNGHASGKKIDLARNSSLDNYIEKKYTYAGVRSDGAKLYKSPSGAIFAKESDHWDVKGWDVQF